MLWRTFCQCYQISQSMRVLQLPRKKTIFAILMGTPLFLQIFQQLPYLVSSTSTQQTNFSAQIYFNEFVIGNNNILTVFQKVHNIREKHYYPRCWSYLNNTSMIPKQIIHLFIFRSNLRVQKSVTANLSCLSNASEAKNSKKFIFFIDLVFEK